jgi:hypothetical protein
MHLRLRTQGCSRRFAWYLLPLTFQSHVYAIFWESPPLQMILIAKSTKPFEYTPKGSPRRQTVLAAYEQEIEEAYASASADASLHDNSPSFSMWSDETAVRVFLQAVVKTVLKGRESMLEEEDLFAIGCDR